MRNFFKIALVLCAGLFAVQGTATPINACDDDECVRYFKQYKKYAKAGYAEAMATLGDLYYNGHGTKANQGKALKQYRKAAKYGSIKGQYKAAMMYMNNPEHRDLDKAVKYLKKAARSNSADAALLLGVIFFKPDYYERDFDEADKWLTRAYKSGHPQAAEFINFMKRTENISAKQMPDLWEAIDDDPTLLNVATQAAEQAPETTVLTAKQREDIEVITVTSDLHNLFDIQLAGLKNTYPDKGAVNTGSKIVGQTCEKNLACGASDKGEFGIMLRGLVGIIDTSVAN